MPGITPNNGSTADGDRDVTRKILDHIDAQVHQIGQQVTQLTEVLDEFRPLLAMLRRPDGKIDLAGAAAVRRRFRARP
jgi:hypothetical protein